MEVKMNQQEIRQLLDSLYEQLINGIAKVSPPIDVLANDYLEKSNDVDTASKKLIKYQIASAQHLAF